MQYPPTSKKENINELINEIWQSRWTFSRWELKNDLWLKCMKVPGYLGSIEGGSQQRAFRNEWGTEITTQTSFLELQKLHVFFSVVQNSSKVTFVASSIFHMDVLHHHLIKSLLLEIYGLFFFSRYNARSQMFAFADKLYAAWLRDDIGNINQLLTFCGVRNFLLLHLSQYSAPVTRNPQRLGLLVTIRVKCGKRCINELKQCVSHCAIYFSPFGTICSHLCDCCCVQNH